MIVETPVKLQPCPFCGGNAVLEKLARGSRMLYISCERCHVKTPMQVAGKQGYCAGIGKIRTEEK